MFALPAHPTTWQGFPESPARQASQQSLGAHADSTARGPAGPCAARGARDAWGAKHIGWGMRRRLRPPAASSALQRWLAARGRPPPAAKEGLANFLATPQTQTGALGTLFLGDVACQELGAEVIRTRTVVLADPWVLGSARAQTHPRPRPAQSQPTPPLTPQPLHACPSAPRHHARPKLRRGAPWSSRPHRATATSTPST